jgi:hypothetical protein
MNNQQWQPTNGPSQYGQPQWNPQQPSVQPSGQLYPGNAPVFNEPSQTLPPMPGASQPLTYAPGLVPPFTGQELGLAEQATSFPPNFPPPQPGQGKLPAPKKRGFLRKRVAVPVWAIMLTALVVFSLLVGVITQSSSAGNGKPSATTSSNTSSSSNGSSTQPTAAPTQGATQAPTPTPTPTHTPKWTTTQTFTGDGNKQTQIFTVGSDWKILWSCDPSSSYGGEYNIIVTVYGSDGTLIDLPINTICKTGNTSDYTEEHQGGSIYLEIDSEGSWKVQVQELQ